MNNGNTRTPADFLLDNEEGPIDFSQIFTVMREKLWLIVLFGLVSLFAGFAYIKQMPRTFRATAVVQMTAQNLRAVNFGQVQPPNTDSPEMADAIVASFRTRQFLSYVVARNHLETDLELIPGSPKTHTAEEAVDALSGMMNVLARRSTPFIDISVQHPSPREAQKLADLIADGSIRQAMERRMGTSQMVVDFLLGEATKLKDQMRHAEEAAQAYVRENNSLSLQEKQDTVVTQLKNNNSELADARAKRMRWEADDEEVRKSDGNPEKLIKIAAVAAQPTIVEALHKIENFETVILTLGLRYTDEHPRMIQARLQLVDAKALLAENLRKIPPLIHSSYESAVATERKFELAMKDQEGQAMELNRQSIAYHSLDREVETNRALYQAILTRLKETEIAKGIEQNPIEIFEHAALPAQPIQPARWKSLAIAVAIGLAAGVGSAFGINALDSSLKSSEQAEQITRLNIVGAIPRASRQDMALGGRTAFGGNPASAFAEAFRSLRAALHLARPAASNTVVLFTSAEPGEGKTFCAVNYSVAVAKQGIRTVIVDADLRLPSVAQLVLRRSESYQGLSDYLESAASLPMAIHPTEIDNLFVMPAGSPSMNPAEILSGPGFSGLISRLREDFHHIVIDTAPLLAVSDTMLLLENADLICLVASAGKTPRKAVLRATKILTEAKAKPDGLILNRLSVVRSFDRYAGKYGGANYPRLALNPAPRPAAPSPAS